MSLCFYAIGIAGGRYYVAYSVSSVCDPFESLLLSLETICTCHIMRGRRGCNHKYQRKVRAFKAGFPMRLPML